MNTICSGVTARLAVAAASLLLVCLAVASPARASFPGANGQIAFFSQFRNNEPEGIYVINPDGTGPRRFSIPGFNYDPAWSSDGTWLAFRACPPLASTGCTTDEEVWKVRADGTGVVNLTNNPANDWDPAWSPGDARIAFTSTRTGGHAVWTMGADGASPARVGPGEHPDWSPDGGKIAFESLAGGYRSIALVNPDGTGATPLTGGNQDFDPSWSPDGQRIAFARVTGVVGTCPYSCYGVYDIFTMSTDGSGLARLTDNGSISDREPAWSPDGTKIVYTRWDVFTGPTDLAIMNADGSSQAALTSDSPVDTSPSWQPIVTADLSLTKSDSPDPVSVGGPLTYTLAVANTGPQSARGVTLTDQLPKPVRVRSIRADDGHCTQRQRTIVCNLNDIAPDASTAVTIVVRPIRKGTIVNTASVTAAAPSDPNAANNSATATTQVVP